MRKISRKERERQRHCEEILRAAEAVFAEKGYNRARMSDIADAAEFSVGYIYNVWKSKKDLYLGIIESKIKDLKSFIEAKIEETDDPFEKISLLVDAHFSFLEKHQDFFKIYMSETSETDIRIFGTLSTRLKRYRSQQLQMVERIFEKGIEEGIFAPVPAQDLTTALKGMIFAFTLDFLNRTPGENLSDKRNIMKRIFFGSVLMRTRESREELMGT
ncbi:MAG: TetR family transcriptional regulator [Candidatus Latescibacteria bacterium]|nr:TetR family transcriptional regulator [Candidatus Latescibacterota bacterium]NIM21815.1 TetR family transcriptional regulator [Candidatus Latescibacterota bacterium]NIM65953.1 TetR family transcriptional regulator [Candidatus Latescibacterota bacterium]NIO02698.1 TetR family transcriptional regulator [Candidatus Latescibacterota bacterium]NIO29679.1 TetR family transcriptional regulator [Candidatus Latescibacterota bacterium]